MEISKEQLAELLSGNPKSSEWLSAVNQVLPEWKIDTPTEVAAFIAQTAHESQDYERLRENLNYSANGLRATWPTRFRSIAEANQYARNPEKIANKVYADRLGNGSYISGEGWKYRGRGIMQITGKYNYNDCSKAIFGDARLVKNPELLEMPDAAMRSACWYWESRHLSELLMSGGIDAVSKKINGGTLGMAIRAAKFSKALEILNRPQISLSHLQQCTIDEINSITK